MKLTAMEALHLGCMLSKTQTGTYRTVDYLPACIRAFANPERSPETGMMQVVHERHVNPASKEEVLRWMEEEAPGLSTRAIARDNFFFLVKRMAHISSRKIAFLSFATCPVIATWRLFLTLGICALVLEPMQPEFCVSISHSFYRWRHFLSEKNVQPT